MADFNQNVNEAKDFLNLEDKDMKKLPQMLNVLTILTYIGCAFGALMSILAVAGVGFLSSMMGKSKELADVADKVSGGSIWIGLIVGLIGVALCFFGAMKMRNLQKQGFYIYVAGQLIPIIYTFITVGIGFGFIGVIIPIVFIVLYATQLKELS
jgi:hypothetical protein